MGSKYLFKLEYDNEKFSSFFVNLYEKKDYNFADLTNDIRSYVRSLQYVTPSTIRIRFKDDDGDYVNLSYGDGEMFKEMFETANPVKDRDYKRIYLKVSQLDSPVLNPLRFQSRSGAINVRFVAASGPLKELTIPQLELQAAVLASRLCKTTENEFCIQLKESIQFIDSAIVLAWIRSQGRRLKLSVSSRVGEIQCIVQPFQWTHIPTECNVADDVSRGLSVVKLSDRWKNGPKFLHLPKENWPVDNTKPDPKEVERESRNTQMVAAVTTNGTTATCVID